MGLGVVLALATMLFAARASYRWHADTQLTAAVANVELALRVLGCDTTVTLFPDLLRPDLVARIHVLGRREATAHEVQLYSAIFRRRSYLFAARPRLPRRWSRSAPRWVLVLLLSIRR